MDPNASQALVKKRQLADTLRGEFEATLNDRVNRFFEVRPHEIIPNTHFAPVSTEASMLFRDGHFYGCIALTQATGEALARFMCQKNKFKPAKVFETNVDKLYKRGFINPALRSDLIGLWTGRDDYHHLNPNIEQDRQRLTQLAQEKIKLLQKIEREVFAFSVRNGALVPKCPQYWDMDDENQTQVYLRLD
ncbi:MAG: hypothetical protein A2749_02165 [Parcubacteria group bacterium RIFCSPHIGHO2_01_FULL_45_26]|nr:MAG: hypothetical protein A2749_02165 [Parcubacteria group bacterium RIFCSPHIGHO2_01_FULL_45_26]